MHFYVRKFTSKHDFRICRLDIVYYFDGDTYISYTLKDLKRKPTDYLRNIDQSLQDISLMSLRMWLLSVRPIFFEYFTNIAYTILVAQLLEGYLRQAS